MDASSDTARKSNSSALVERRAFVRLASELTANCRAAGSKAAVSWPGKVRNISQGGLALVVRHRFRSGTYLEAELRDRSGRVCRTVRLRVVHTTAVSDQGSHAWLLGCAFDTRESV